MTRPTLDKKTCYLAGQDKANRQMRKGGRTAWNEEDWNEAVKEYDRLCQLLEEPDTQEDLRVIIKEHRRQAEPEGSPYEIYNWNER